MAHLFDLHKVLQPNQSHSTLAVSSPALMLVKLSGKRRVRACCCYQSGGRFHLRKGGEFKFNWFHFISQCWWWTGTNSQSSTSRALAWIHCKLGKQYLLNKVTPPWESNPEPFSYPGNYGYHRSVCWVKKFTCGHLPQIPSKIGPPLLPTIRLRADTILTP